MSEAGEAHGGPDQPTQARIEELVALCLEARLEFRLEARTPAAADVAATVCAGDPELLGEVRAALALLDSAGLGLRDAGPNALADARANAQARALPERLDDFRLVRCIGSGGMGLVFLAVQESLDREVALKVVRPEYALFDRARERFRREVELVARLDHPNIVPVHAVGEAEGVPYFVMEYIRGITCAELVDELRSTPPEQLDGASLGRALSARTGERPRVPLPAGSWPDAVVDIMGDVARAVGHAHGAGVLHRDVKPSNVLWSRDGRVLLVDFGLARALGADSFTAAGAPLGSLPYMAPELLKGDADADVRSDVYAMGATLYELLTLRPPFLARNREALTQHILAGDLIPPHELNPGLPADLETVCLTALDPDPRRRYASAEALARDLGNLAARRPIEARRPGPGLRLRRWSQRHPVLSVVLVSALLLSLGATWFGLEQARLRADVAAQAYQKSLAFGFLMDLFEQADRAPDADQGAVSRQMLDLGARMLEGSLHDVPLVRAAFLDLLGELYRRRGDLAAARPFLDEGLALREAHAGADSVELAESLVSLGRLHRDGQDHAAALAALERAVALLDAQLGPSDPASAGALHELYAERLEAGQSLPAALVEDLLSRRRGLHGDGSREAVASLNLLALVRLRSGQAQNARRLLEAAQATCARIASPLDSLSRQTDRNLARLLAELGDDRGAEAVQRGLRAAVITLYGEQHPDVTGLTLDLAQSLRSQGRHAEAAELYATGVAQRRAQGLDPGRVAPLLFQQAINLCALDRRDEAEQLFDEVLALALAQGEQGRFLQAELWHVRGREAHRAGELETARAAYERAATLYDQNQRMSGCAAWARLHLALVLRAQGQSGRADALIAAALPVLRADVEKRTAEASVRSTRWFEYHELLGAAWLMAGQPGEAEAVLRPLLSAAQDDFGDDHWLPANARSLLGEALADQGRFEQAEPLLLASHGLLVADRGPDHDLTARAVERLVRLYTAWGRAETAETWRRQLPARALGPAWRGYPG